MPAIKYFGAGGVDDASPGRGDSAGDPYLTFEYALASTSNGDTLVAIDGEYTAATFTDIVDKRTLKANNFRQTTIKAASGTTSRVLRLPANLTVADDGTLIEDVILDAESGRVNQCIEIQTAAAGPDLLRIKGVEMKGGLNYQALVSIKKGRQEFVACKLSGLMELNGIATTGSLSEDGNQTLLIDGLDLDVDLDTGSGSLIKATKVSNIPANTLDVIVQGLRGRVNLLDDAAYTLVDISGAVAPHISGLDLTVNAPPSGVQDCLGLYVHGRDVNTQTTDALLSGGVINFNVEQGYAIAYGAPLADSFLTGGLITGFNIKGKYYSGDSPHGIAHGQGTTGVSRGNIVQNIYVGVLLSKTAAGTVTEGNLLHGCYGPSIYAKGTTGGVARRNTAVVPRTHEQRNQGILSVINQLTQDTTGFDYEENLVIVQDMSRVHSLGYIGIPNSVSHVCTYSNNIYVVPDTVDVENDPLFAYESATANYTLAQWNALAGSAVVTDDVVLTLPQAQIDALVDSYARIAEGTGNQGSILRDIERLLVRGV